MPDARNGRIPVIELNPAQNQLGRLIGHVLSDGVYKPIEKPIWVGIVLDGVRFSATIPTAKGRHFCTDTTRRMLVINECAGKAYRAMVRGSGSADRTTIDGTTRDTWRVALAGLNESNQQAELVILFTTGEADLETIFVKIMALQEPMYQAVAVDAQSFGRLSWTALRG